MKILNHVAIKMGIICTVVISIINIGCKEKGTHILTTADSISIYNAIAATKTFTFGKPGVDKNGGERIDPDTAKIMITEFEKEESDPQIFPLKTLNGENLRGFYIKKEIFDTLINRKHAEGIRLLFAKLPNGGPKAYTLVIYGTQRDKDKNLTDTTQYNVPSMGVYEYIDPCPDNCGTRKN